MALLHLKETDIETLEVADPFVEGEIKEENWAERSLFYNCRTNFENTKRIRDKKIRQKS